MREATDREQYELLLLKKAVETMQLGVTIVDLEQRIIYSNPADAEMHGYEPAELVGQKGSLFAKPANTRRLSNKDIRLMTSWRRETTNVRKDGSEFPVEVLSDVVLDARGEPIGIVSMCRDLTDQKLAEAALAESRERYTLAVEGANDGVWDWDIRRGTFFTSPRWQEIVGAKATEINGTSEDWLERIHPEEVDGVRQTLEEHMSGATPHFESEHRIHSPAGGYLWVLVRGLAVRDETGATRMAGSLCDITGRKVEDPLTGLPNRVLFMDRLESALARCRRRGTEVGVLFLDLDRFKVVNDSLGHSVGDQLLVEVSRVFSGCIRSEDTVARIGGDEFAFLIESVGDIGQVVQFAERIQHALEQVHQVGDKEIFAQASIGIAIGNGDVVAEELVQQADTAMYDVKARERGDYKIYDRELSERARNSLSLEMDLRSALQTNSIEVAYQPIIEPQTETIRGFEALARWNHSERGPVPPGDFVPVAETSGLIFELGRQVLLESCCQLARWQSELPAANDLKMHVNVSAKQFNYPGLIEHVGEAVQTSGIEPGSLELEITESAFIHDLERAKRTLEQLQSLGVRVWLDDFGTGYSSLSYIHRFPVNGLKIDRSFVSALCSQPNTELNLARSIVNLAADMGISVVAEGVETTTQADRLLELQCDLVQGYLYGRPKSADEAFASIANERVSAAVES